MHVQWRRLTGGFKRQIVFFLLSAARYMCKLADGEINARNGMAFVAWGNFKFQISGSKFQVEYWEAVITWNLKP